MANILNVILLSAGIGSGSLAIFVFSQPLIATATILVVTPLIREIVDDALAEKWPETITIFLGITGFIHVSVWTLTAIIGATNIIDRVQLCLIVIGAGAIQLAWMFLVTETRTISQIEYVD